LPIGHSFIELGSVDSTNNYAMAQVHAGSASHGAIFFAHEQWAGKGQRGKTWASAPGENIILTAVLKPATPSMAGQFCLNAAVALSCHDLFSRYAGKEHTRIKWPNDLYWRDRKAGGILVENSIRGDHWTVALAGVGININQTRFPETLRNPVSLRQITGRAFNAVDMAKELAADLEHRYEQLVSKGGKTILDKYNRRLYMTGRTVTLKYDQAAIETTIQRVTKRGELVTRDSVERRFRFGEVEWQAEE
jgi:BirA family transcriptional regulator, biotin operon repressor / biotin---[acetyl-CoA-carboxylase] ligase